MRIAPITPATGRSVALLSFPFPSASRVRGMQSRRFPLRRNRSAASGVARKRDKSRVAGGSACSATELLFLSSVLNAFPSVTRHDRLRGLVFSLDCRINPSKLRGCIRIRLAALRRDESEGTKERTNERAAPRLLNWVNRFSSRLAVESSPRRCSRNERERRIGRRYKTRTINSRARCLSLRDDEFPASEARKPDRMRERERERRGK